MSIGRSVMPILLSLSSSGLGCVAAGDIEGDVAVPPAELAGPASSYVTATVLDVNGGLH